MQLGLASAPSMSYPSLIHDVQAQQFLYGPPLLPRQGLYGPTTIFSLYKSLLSLMANYFFYSQRIDVFQCLLYYLRDWRQLFLFFVL